MDIKLLGADELKALMKQKKVYLVDVRTLEEYKSGHINGAVNIPSEKIEEIGNDNSSLFKKFADMKKCGYSIVFYCRSGSRSMISARILKEQGIDCSSLYGGIEEFVIDE